MLSLKAIKSTRENDEDTTAANCIAIGFDGLHFSPSFFTCLDCRLATELEMLKWIVKQPR
jgi:hypothetical protein